MTIGHALAEPTEKPDTFEAEVEYHIMNRARGITERLYRTEEADQAIDNFHHDLYALLSDRANCMFVHHPIFKQFKTLYEEAAESFTEHNE